MTRLLVGFASVLALAAGGGLAACSSSSSSAGPDGGVDASGSSSGGSGSSSGGRVSDAAVPPPVSDGGPCIVATSVPGAQIPGYLPVQVVPGACSGAQIAAFVAACISGTANATDCSNFQADTKHNAACVNCLLPITDAGASINTGAVLVDYTGIAIVGANTPGCIAVADPTSGPACAGGLESLFQCETQACSSGDCRLADAATYGACLTASENGACATQYSASSPCAVEYTDGGAAIAGGRCATPTQVIDRICGTGM